MPTVSESNSAGFLTVDIHVQQLLETVAGSDESGKAHQGASELGTMQRDGLAHIFAASPGSLVPQQQAALSLSFWVYEIRANYLRKID